MSRWSTLRCLLLAGPVAIGLLLSAGGCDVGAAQDAFESAGVIVELPSIETTVSGQFVDAATGELVQVPVTLQFRGPDGGAVVDMYSDPISSQAVSGAVTSFGIRNGASPSPQDPVRLHVVARAEGYQATSEVLEVSDTGSEQFTLRLLSDDPTQLPAGASGIRETAGSAAQDGTVEADLDVETPAEGKTGQAALHLPANSVLRNRRTPIKGNLTVDLSHYPPNDETLAALPGDGTVGTTVGTERFVVAGYANLQITDATGTPATWIDDHEADEDRSQTVVRLPQNAGHPATEKSIERGDKLTLFRYNSGTGTWHADTTLTVQVLDREQKSKKGPTPPGNPSSLDGHLGIQWSPDSLGTGWWAWGTRAQTTCQTDASVQVNDNGQSGAVEVTLKRTGLRYSASHSVEYLTESPRSVGTLIGSSSVPQHTDYELTLTTQDGQSQTINNVAPCSGTYSISLPAPTPTPRADVLFRAHPECPGDQKVRITSMPTVTIYYRESNAPGGTRWHTAGQDKITWVMDDPDSPTYVRWAELRLNGLKQNTRYDMYTTYDGNRYEASGHVPSNEEATIEGERILVEYSQDFSNMCS